MLFTAENAEIAGEVLLNVFLGGLCVLSGKQK
jgi:hypothetical protein